LLGLGNGPASLPALDVSSGARRDPSSDAPHSSSNKEQSALVRFRRPAGFSLSRHRVSDPILVQPLNPMVEAKEPGAPPYHTPTSLSRLIPRMELFHKVMKDELCYTTTITVTTVILALLLVLGVNFENGLDMIGWVATNWAIISILVIHSFGRVVRRHEKEALLQHPSTWWPERHRSPYSRRAFSRSQLRVRVPEDPFSDARGIRESTTSWNSEFSDSPSSPSPVASRDRRLSLSSPYSELPSNRNTLLDSGPPDGADPTVLSSLNGWQNGGTSIRFSGTSADEKTVSHVKYRS